METTKENVKLPSYAIKLGKGMFAGGVYGWFVCRNCGARVQFMSGDGTLPPPPDYHGKCPDSPRSGNHVWQRA